MLSLWGGSDPQTTKKAPDLSGAFPYLFEVEASYEA
jgi:hypothetical protein